MKRPAKKATPAKTRARNGASRKISSAKTSSAKTNGANSGPYTVLPGSRRYHRPGAEVLGRADTNEWVDLTVKLRRAKALPEPVAGKAVVSREDFTKRYGATDKDLAKVEGVLAKAGLTVASKDAATRTLKVGGPVNAMEKAFQVHLLRCKHGDHIYRGRVGDIHIPRALDGIVTAVFGLDTRRMTRHRRGQAVATEHVLKPASQRSSFLPQELAEAYQFPPGTGAGQTIGIIELGGRFVASDLKQFAQMAGLSAVPQVVVVNAETVAPKDRTNDDEAVECMLDVEVIAGICPQATLAVYFSNFTEKGWVDALDAALHDQTNKPSVLSISYGFAEGQLIWTGQAMSTVNDSMKEAAALGIPVCIASGDDGSDDQVGDGRAHVDFPSTSEFVLSVGGTALHKANGGGAPTEVVWFDGSGLRPNGGSGGGGVSEVMPRPTFQQKLNIASVNPQAPAGRIVPDVSANAASSTGYQMIALGKSIVVGGTSAAAPLWAALIARLSGAGKQVGYITPLFYQANPKTGGKPLGAAALNDITKGNNDTAAAGGYAAGPGFDAVGGWGSPNGQKLMQMLP